MRILSVILMALYATNAQAHDGNDGWVKISNFKLWSNTYQSDVIRIETSDGYYNPAGRCSNLDSYMVSTVLSLEIQQRIFSTLLAALMAGKDIRLRLDTQLCEQDRPSILNVTIQ